MEKKILILSAKQIDVTFIPSTKDVAFRFDLADSSLALMPEMELSVRLSPNEARSLAALLSKKAAQAEGLEPQ